MTNVRLARKLPPVLESHRLLHRVKLRMNVVTGLTVEVKGLQVVAVQLDIAWEQREANHARVRELLRQDKPHAGSLIVLPEMFASGFSMHVSAIADDDRSTERCIQSIAREYGSFVLAGVTQRRAGAQRGRNCALAIDPSGETIANYCKLHPFSLGHEDRKSSRSTAAISPSRRSSVMTCGFRRFSDPPFVAVRTCSASSRIGRTHACSIG
jgi:hypothetical protein